MPGFTAPGVLFAGNSAAQDRAFWRAVLGPLHRAGYHRYVEVGVGSYAATLVAVNSGVPPTVMETSDVTLYTSILGTCVSGGRLEDLGVRLDGDPVPIPDGSLIEQTAELLYVQLLARTQAKADGVDYWENIVIDLERGRDRHLAALRDTLGNMTARLTGVKFTPMCMWDHIRLVADDPHAMIVAAPPSYKSGFEKFFNTDGRLTWDEPPYEIFDPSVDMQRLSDEMAGRAALLMFLQEDETGNAAHPRPVFAHPLSPGRTAYIVTNRPDEVFAITGGPTVSPRSTAGTTPTEMPIIPFGYQVRPDSTITLVPVKQPVVDYYRDLWMHRLNAGRAGAGYPLLVLVLVDGMVAGIVHYSPTSMTRSHVYGKGGERWARHIILSFAYGAPHESLRLGRLVTAIALQRPTAAVAFGNTGQGPIWLAASLGLVTSEMTRHPEAKGLRGLMELVHRDKHQDGYKLVYEAAWSDTPLPEVVADFVKKELRWQQNRQKQRANAGA